MTQSSSATSHARRRWARILGRVAGMAAIFIGGFFAGNWAKRKQNVQLSSEGTEWGQVIPRVKMHRPTLRQALTELAPLGHTEIAVDWPALREAAIPTDTPLEIDLDLRDVTLDVVLPRVESAVLKTCPGRSRDSPEKFECQASGGRLLATTSARLNALQPYWRAYDIRALLAPIPGPDVWKNESSGLILDGPPMSPEMSRAADLIRFIEETIAPETWWDAGGSIGQIYCFDGRLFVFQTPRSHRELFHLLRALEGLE